MTPEEPSAGGRRATRAGTAADDEGAPQPLKLDEWLALLRDAAGIGGELPAVDRRTERALLDLARVAAHRSERVAAPISSYVLGLAAAAIPEDERAAWLEGLAAALEGEAAG